ncbi:MAG: hypothetical protein GVY17_05385 [Cyanobacteria bacterium]|jgi:hypothetical protein|nr:hypothetical protein [Cyanobacteria bacterium GSL.Bin21]
MTYTTEEIQKLNLGLQTKEKDEVAQITQTSQTLETELYDHYSAEELYALTQSGGSCFSIPAIPGAAICYEFKGKGIYLWAKFGPIESGKHYLGLDGACTSLGGHGGGFALEVQACFHSSPLRLDGKARACAPVLGCKEATWNHKI